MKLKLPLPIIFLLTISSSLLATVSVKRSALYATFETRKYHRSILKGENLRKNCQMDASSCILTIETSPQVLDYGRYNDFPNVSRTMEIIGPRLNDQTATSFSFDLPLNELSGHVHKGQQPVLIFSFAWNSVKVETFYLNGAGLDTLEKYIDENIEKLPEFITIDFIRIPFKNTIASISPKYSSYIKDEKAPAKPVLSELSVDAFLRSCQNSKSSSASFCELRSFTAELPDAYILSVEESKRQTKLVVNQDEIEARFNFMAGRYYSSGGTSHNPWANSRFIYSIDYGNISKVQGSFKLVYDQVEEALKQSFKSDPLIATKFVKEKNQKDKILGKYAFGTIYEIPIRDLAGKCKDSFMKVKKNSFVQCQIYTFDGGMGLSSTTFMEQPMVATVEIKGVNNKALSFDVELEVDSYGVGFIALLNTDLPEEDWSTIKPIDSLNAIMKALETSEIFSGILTVHGMEFVGSPY